MDLKNMLTKGTVPLMILEILNQGEAYGYEIVKQITARSRGKLEFGQGTIYPLLYKLEESGYVKSRRSQTPSGKERRYYRITRAGATHLESCKAKWREINEAIGWVLHPGTAGTIALK